MRDNTGITVLPWQSTEHLGLLAMPRAENKDRRSSRASRESKALSTPNFGLQSQKMVKKLIIIIIIIVLSRVPSLWHFVPPAFEIQRD